jgi:hypothetical protein
MKYPFFATKNYIEGYALIPAAIFPVSRTQKFTGNKKHAYNPL